MADLVRLCFCLLRNRFDDNWNFARNERRHMWCYRSVFIQLSRSWEGKQLFCLSCKKNACSKRFEVTCNSGRLCQAFMDNSSWISWPDRHSFNPWISRSKSNSRRHDIRLCYFCICCTLCENRKNFLPVCRKSVHLGNFPGSLCVYPRSLSYNDESRRARNLQVSRKLYLRMFPRANINILYNL